MDATASIAAKHGFSEEAVRVLRRALARTGGAMAQFDHPELGGMGQWTRGGMLMIGAMGDDRLKSRVRALLGDLAGEAAGEPAMRAEAEEERVGWWPQALGAPASSGGQNGIRYAVFPDARRVAVERDGRAEVFDTGSRRLTGVSQTQGRTNSLRFSGPDGDVDLGDLAMVE